MEGLRTLIFEDKLKIRSSRMKVASANKAVKSFCPARRKAKQLFSFIPGKDSHLESLKSVVSEVAFHKSTQSGESLVQFLRRLPID